MKKENEVMRKTGDEGREDVKKKRMLREEEEETVRREKY